MEGGLQIQCITDTMRLYHAAYRMPAHQMHFGYHAVIQKGLTSKTVSPSFIVTSGYQMAGSAGVLGLLSLSMSGYG